jgi:hypothetical protein
VKPPAATAPAPPLSAPAPAPPSSGGLFGFGAPPKPPPPPSKDREAVESALSASREIRDGFASEGYFKEANDAQMRAIGNLFSLGPPTPPPKRAPAPTATPTPARAAVGSTPLSSPSLGEGRACVKDEPGCVSTTKAAGKRPIGAYMVPWALPSSASADVAAKQLRGWLKGEGASEVAISSAGEARQVRATFSTGPLGLPSVQDTVEFSLSEGRAAFRASASSASWPFSSSGAALKRNQERLMRVRKRAFSKGWSCACPPDAGLGCSLFCN